MLIVAGGRRVGDQPSILDNPKRRSRLSFRNQIEDRHGSHVSDQTLEIRRIEDLQAALAQFADIASDLKK